MTSLIFLIMLSLNKNVFGETIISPVINVNLFIRRIIVNCISKSYDKYHFYTSAQNKKGQAEKTLLQLSIFLTNGNQIFACL